MVKFRCEHCQKKLGVPDEHAGKRVRCPQCGQPVEVPQPEEELLNEIEWQEDLLDSSPNEEGGPLAEQLDGELPAAPPFVPAPMAEGAAASEAGSVLAGVGRFPLAIGAGIGAALIGAAAWAGVVYVTDYELGILSWFIGGFVGYAVMLFGGQRTKALGVLAACCAIFSIASAKAMIVKWYVLPEMNKLLTSQEYREEEIGEDAFELSPDEVAALVEDPQEFFLFACHQLADDGLWDREHAADISNVYTAQTQDLSEELERYTPEQIEQINADIETVLAAQETWLPVKKRNVVKVQHRVLAEAMLQAFAAALTETRQGFIAALKETFSLFDILWIFLSVSTAYKLASD